jgi:hypothetical protein
MHPVPRAKAADRPRGFQFKMLCSILASASATRALPVQHAFPTRSTRESLGMEVGRVGEQHVTGGPPDSGQYKTERYESVQEA